ncbi:bile acid:sodium symporter [Natronomonas amylolytica]|uniref:bile acid:sodium symporter n=1 Tax=Natronomonas amylolytica TaxID=3108498 RepID=UPI00300A81E4
MLVVLSLCFSYLLLPAVGIQVADALLTDNAAFGMAIVLSVPTTAGSAIVWTRFSNSDVQLSTTISLVSLLLAPVVTPLVLSQLVGSQVALPVSTIFGNLLLIIGGGVLVDVVISSDAISSQLVHDGSTLTIALLIYTSVSKVGSVVLSAEVLLSLITVSILLLGIGLGISVVSLKVLQYSTDEMLPLFFTSSLKNLGIALLVAFAYNNSLVLVSVITYYVIQQVAGALTADIVTSSLCSR